MNATSADILMEEGKGSPRYSSSQAYGIGSDILSSPGLPSTMSEYATRVFQFDQMDFQYTYSQMVSLCRFSPQEVYKATQIRKKIKDQWARDDPAFVVILSVMVSVSALAYSITFGVSGVIHLLRVILGAILFDFLGTGCVVATVTSFVANKYMRAQRVLTTDQRVEWLYAFDVHCNGFFPLYVLLYVVQFFLTPILLQPDFVSTVLANTLYAGSLIYYWYITVLGFSILPFLREQNRFFYPAGAILVLYLIACVVNFNASRFTLNLYFGS